jgi:CO dehydrogenase nickel-insertion accessory protein CooC1
LPNASAWAQVRPGEIVRVVDRLAADSRIVVVDGAGILEEVSAGAARGRYATARTMVGDADVLVAVCDASPHAVGRFLGWAVEAHALSPTTSVIVVVNRAPSERFRRGELYAEISGSLPIVDVVFVPVDRRVGDAAWNGTATGRGPFTRAVDQVARHVLAAQSTDAVELRPAS